MREGQTWDAQVFVQPDGESEVVEWAIDRGASYEVVIEAPVGTLIDSSELQRSFVLVGLGGYGDGESMRQTEIIDGSEPAPNTAIIEVMMDEGSLQMTGWKVGDRQSVSISGNELEVDIVGSVRGEISRTMFFHQTDLAGVIGFNATAVYLEFPEGVSVDEELGILSSGIQERESLLRGIESLLDQQTQVLGTIMVLGFIFTLAVMFNTMVMNHADRDFELATLRVLGASTGSLSVMLLFESTIIGLIGGLLGVIFAFGGALGLAAEFSTWQFYFPVVLVPNVAIQLILVVLLISVAMVPVGILRIRNMNLVEKVKDLSQ